MLSDRTVSSTPENILEKLFDKLPLYPDFAKDIRRAPMRSVSLSRQETELALRNALRYIPHKWHKQMAPEFLEELRTRGRIYGYRFRPPGHIKAEPVEEYKGNCLEGKAFQVMTDNNLDFDVALYPYELTTYGETGQVCQNWMQYRIIKAYLEILTSEQTLVMASGHPLGLFASSPAAPRVIITNALMVGMFDNAENFNRAAALGVANYGQMTAGGWMYIGPQGIVHGTYSTLLNAARSKRGIAQESDLRGLLFVSSGLGGMSGAQGKAVEIAHGVGIIAEVDESRIQTRQKQGWVNQVTDNPAHAFSLAKEYQSKKEQMSIAFYGNIVDLLEYAADHSVPIDLLSDQTSCHVAYEGGYCPQNLTFAQRTEMLRTDPQQFREMVNNSLKRHCELIKAIANQGAYFFDYGNSFLKAVYDAGVKNICRNGKDPGSDSALKAKYFDGNTTYTTIVEGVYYFKDGM